MAIRDSYDVVILGVGPAGLQAAVHAGRRKASVLLLGSVRKSSLFTAHIENYFSLFNISGEEMLKRGTEQARQFGADFLEESVIGIVPDANVFRVTTESGRVLEARSIILATGSKRNTWRHLRPALADGQGRGRGLRGRNGSGGLRQKAASGFKAR